MNEKPFEDFGFDGDGLQQETSDGACACTSECELW